MTDGPPAIVTDVSNVAASLEEQQEELESFRATIEDYKLRVQNMSEGERSAFYESADNLQDSVEAATAVDSVLQFEDDIEAAIRAPLERVAVDSLNEFIAEADLELTESTREEIFDRLSGHIPEDLEKAAEAYQTLTPRVRDLPTHLRDSLAAYIEETPSRLLTPKEDVEPWIENLEDRYEQLQNLESTFEEAGGWTPSIAFTGTDRFYGDLNSQLPVERIKKSLDTIQAEGGDVDDGGLPIESVVASELEDRLSSVSATGIASAVGEVETEVTSLTQLYDDIDKHVEALNTFGTDAGLFEDEIDDLLAHHRQLGIEQYATLEELESTVSELDAEIDDFIQTVQTRLKAQQNMVSTLDVGTSDDAPEINLGTGGPVLQVHVEENLLQALRDCKAHDDWIATQLDTTNQDVDRDEILDIWSDLSEGDEVELTKEDEDAILALADRLPLSVVLRGN